METRKPLESSFVKTAISFTYIRFITAGTSDLINKITAGEIRNFIFVGNEIRDFKFNMLFPCKVFGLF